MTNTTTPSPTSQAPTPAHTRPRPSLYWRKREERLSELVVLLDTLFCAAVERADDERARVLDARESRAIAAWEHAAARSW